MFSHGCVAKDRPISHSRAWGEKNKKKDAPLLKFKVRGGNVHEELRGSPL